ncbi:DUF4262 domain-containing protein [Cytobacillus praedii]|uniref:DUF4262 domain-containing protein n=1 Tax=Cytobacillus praedii TaxID=1742358 RepID=UPI002E1F5761|nr:DUF4262 domain-containing protein [Cytobacillus praedii]
MKMTTNEMMEKYGWLIHFVSETDLNEFNGLSNIHTHGLKENFNHSDFQVFLPVDPQTIHPILIMMVEQVKEGKVFETGKKDSQVLQGFDVIFKEFEEEDRTVMRLILPDPNGKFPGEEGCMAPYSRQFEELPKMKLSFIVDRSIKKIKKD